MDDYKIHVLLAAIRTGSFRKAALELNCTQSAVTQSMNSLENELGCKVLQRNHNGIRLTPAGEELLPLLLEADASLARLSERARQVAGGAFIPLRIGAFSSISSTWFPQILQEYHALYPETTFDIRVGTDVLSNWLLNGTIDLALGDSARCRAFRWLPLMDDPYFAVLPKSLAPKCDSISQEDLADYPFVMAPMNALDRYLSVCPANQLRVNCDDDSTLLSMVAQGIGVTAMPQLCLQKLPEQVCVLQLTPPTKRVLGVALPNSPSKEAVRFARHLKQKFSYSTT